MADRPVSVGEGLDACEEAVDRARKPWTAPHLRSLSTSAAENGPNFPQFDGIEGHS